MDSASSYIYLTTVEPLVIRTPNGHTQAGPHYRNVRIIEPLGIVWTLVSSGPRELPVIDRCPYYMEVLVSRGWTVYYWIQFDTNKSNNNFTDFILAYGVYHLSELTGQIWQFLQGHQNGPHRKSEEPRGKLSEPATFRKRRIKLTICSDEVCHYYLPEPSSRTGLFVNSHS